MKKDGSWKDFFEDPARFADAINGFGSLKKRFILLAFGILKIQVYLKQICGMCLIFCAT